MQLPLIQMQHPGMHVGLKQVLIMGSQNDRGPMGIEAIQDIQKTHRSLRIYITSRFVSQEDLGIDHNGPGNSHPLLLSSGEVSTHGMFFAFQLQPPENSIHPAMNLIPGQVAYDQGEGNVFPNAALGKNHKILKNNRHIPAQEVQAFLGQAVQIVPGNERDTFLNGQRTMQKTQKGRFAGSGRAGHHDEFSRHDVEIDALDGP